MLCAPFKKKANKQKTLDFTSSADHHPFFVTFAARSVTVIYLYLLFSTITLLPYSNPHQPGFHSHHFAIAALIRVTHDFHSAIPNGQFSTLTLLELSTAFDPAVCFPSQFTFSSRLVVHHAPGFSPTSLVAPWQPVLLVIPLLPQSLNVGGLQGSFFILFFVLSLFLPLVILCSPMAVNTIYVLATPKYVSLAYTFLTNFRLVYPTASSEFVFRCLTYCKLNMPQLGSWSLQIFSSQSLLQLGW